MPNKNATKGEGPVLSTNPTMRVVSILMPVFIVAAVAYELYLVPGHILMDQYHNKYHQVSVAIGLIVPFVLIAALLLITFARILFTIYTDPGIIPRGPEYARYYHGNNRMRYRDRRRSRAVQKARDEQEGQSLSDRRLSRRARAALGGNPVDLESGLVGHPYSSSGTSDSNGTAARAHRTVEPRLDPDSPGLELFYTKDAFECAADGRPIWCNDCGTWKPDRTHHSSELGRCVRKMDHFCPWVGGIVSETTFKFFVQFNFYATLLAIFVLSICAACLARQRSLGESTDARPIVGLVLACVLGSFAFSILLSCLHFVFFNTTSVEVHQRTDRVKMMAIRIRQGSAPVPGVYDVVEYPLPKDEPPAARTNGHTNGGGPYGSLNGNGTASGLSDSPSNGLTTNINGLQHDGPLPLEVQLQPQNHLSPTLQDDAEPPEDPFKAARAARAARRTARDQLAYRTFAIVTLDKRMNVWNLGWRQNFLSIMGTNPFDWLLPVRKSPFCTNESNRSFYPLGPDFEKLRADYRLPPLSEMEEVHQ